MIRVIRICRKCGAKVFSDAPEGLCTGCVLEAAIGATSDDDGSSARDVEVTERPRRLMEEVDARC